MSLEEERTFVAINRSVGEWRDIVEYLRNAIDKHCYAPSDADNVEAIAESIEKNLPPAPVIP